MKITKRQLRRIIKEEKYRLLKEQPYSPEPGSEASADGPYPGDRGDDLYFVAEEALHALLGALASMDPGAAGDMARYAIDELHGYKK